MARLVSSEPGRRAREESSPGAHSRNPLIGGIGQSSPPSCSPAPPPAEGAGALGVVGALGYEVDVVVGVVPGGGAGIVVVVVVGFGGAGGRRRSFERRASPSGGGASSLPADNGSEARPIRWLTSWLAATEIPAATASPAKASTVHRSQPGTVNLGPASAPRTMAPSATIRSLHARRARPC